MQREYNSQQYFEMKTGKEVPTLAECSGYVRAVAS